MKLYTGRGPNPKAVRIALAEKGIDYERIEVDIVKNESRTGDYVARVNPLGTIPALETDDGQIICEVTAITEYLDELQPTPPLIGTTPAERAETRMWSRRIDLEIYAPMGLAFQGGAMRAFFEGRKALAPAESVPAFLAMAHERLAWLEAQMTGRTWICGERFTWADIPLWCVLDFFTRYGKQTVPSGGWFDDWRTRVKARPSSAA